MQRHGWNLLFHDCLIEQLQKLEAAALRAKAQDPAGFKSNANVKLFDALAKLILEVVPSDPNRDEYRQGNTMGAAFRHWRRSKIGCSFGLTPRRGSSSSLG
jgi:toxin YhaV